MSSKPYYAHFKDPERKLIKWWEELHGKGEFARRTNLSGARALLKRAESSADVMLSPVYYKLLNLFTGENRKGRNALAFAITAGILSHVRSNDESRTFAGQLGRPKEPGGTRAAVSELRFQQLAKSSTPDEFYRRLIRTINLLDKKVNVLSLTDSIFHWVNEHRFGKDQNPEKRLVVQWSGDYYQALLTSNQ